MSENLAAKLFQDATIEDLANDPHKYGLPTFSEYCKNPDRYAMVQSELQKMNTWDNGPKQSRRQLRNKIWIVKGYRCATAEKAQAVAEELNIDLRYMNPQMRDIGQHKYDLYMHFDTEKKPNGLITAT